MRIVIPDDYQDAVRHLACIETLAGHQVTVYHDHTEDIETLATGFQEADALVLIRERTPITGPLLAWLPALKLIVQMGRQAPHLDLDACTRHGIVVAFSEGGSNPYATAELTWGLILAARRHIPQEVAQMKTGHWQTTLGLGLYGQALGSLPGGFRRRRCPYPTWTGGNAFASSCGSTLQRHCLHEDLGGKCCASLHSIYRRARFSVGVGVQSEPMGRICRVVTARWPVRVGHAARQSREDEWSGRSGYRATPRLCATRSMDV